MTNQQKMQLCKDILARAFEHIEKIDPTFVVMNGRGVNARKVKIDGVRICTCFPTGKVKEELVS